MGGTQKEDVADPSKATMKVMVETGEETIDIVAVVEAVMAKTSSGVVIVTVVAKLVAAAAAATVLVVQAK